MIICFSSQYLLLADAAAALAVLAGCHGRPNAEATATAPPAALVDATAGPGWALLNFVKADSANPIMGPSPVGRFMDPFLKKVVLWEEKDVLTSP